MDDRQQSSWTNSAVICRGMPVLPATGVPRVTAPASRGFGTTLIDRSLNANGGEAAIRYGFNGIVCEIRLPLPEDDQRITGIYAAASQDQRVPGSALDAIPPRLRGKRILLVEDEPLVAMDIEAQLIVSTALIEKPPGSMPPLSSGWPEAPTQAASLPLKKTGPTVAMSGWWIAPR
jgi:hypothetical protein